MQYLRECSTVLKRIISVYYYISLGQAGIYIIYSKVTFEIIFF